MTTIGDTTTDSASTETEEMLRHFRDSIRRQWPPDMPPTNTPICPNCGRCPHCGRGGEPYDFRRWEVWC